MSESKKRYSLDLGLNKNEDTSGSCGCGKSQGSCNSHKEEELSPDEFYEAAINASIGEERHRDGFEQVFDVKMDRRTAFKKLTASLTYWRWCGISSCTSVVKDAENSKEKAQIDWEEQFKGNYKLMTDEEKEGTYK